MTTGPAPNTSTSCTPDVPHVMNDTRPSPFFTALCIIVNANRRTERNGVAGNKANTMYGDGTTTVCYDFPNLVCLIGASW